MRADLVTVRDTLITRVAEWQFPPATHGPVDSEIAFIRSCARLHAWLFTAYPDLAEDADALEMLQGLAVDILRPRVGSRMRTAREGMMPGLSLGTAEAVAAARLAADGLARDVMVATSIMSQGIECAPWDHIPGVPAHLWVLPAICSALSPDEFFSEEALAGEPPPASYWFNGEKGTLWFRLAYEIRALRPGISDAEREQFRAWAYENWLAWAEAHEFGEDFPDPLRSSTFDVSFTDRASDFAAHARGIKLGRSGLLPEAWVRRARAADGYDDRQALQAAHLYYWAAAESHLLLDATDDLDAVLREHPWISQWYPEALEDPANDPEPIWPPDKEVLVKELDRRLATLDRTRPWASVQSAWTGEGTFNVESGFMVLTNDTNYPKCDCWERAILATGPACGRCGRPARSRVATKAGDGDGFFPVYGLTDDSGSLHGALAMFDIGSVTLGAGKPFSPSDLLDHFRPLYCGTIENHGSLSFCEATTATDNGNDIVTVALPPGPYHVIAWEDDDDIEALAAYDQNVMDELTALVGEIGPKVWDTDDQPPERTADSAPPPPRASSGPDAAADIKDAITPEDVDSGLRTEEAAAEAALERSDLVAAEFWYMKAIIAKRPPSERLVRTCIGYIQNVLEKSGRLAEAALLLEAVAVLPFPQMRLAVATERAWLAHLRGVNGYVRHTYSGAWIDADLAPATSRPPSSNDQYLRCIRELHETATRLPDGDTALLLDPSADGHVVRLMRAVRRLNNASGADTEALLQGLYDWLQAERSGQVAVDLARRDAERSYSDLLTGIASTSVSPSRRGRSVRPVVIGSAAAALALGAILWAGIANSGQRSEAGGPAPSSPVTTSSDTTSEAPTPAPSASNAAPRAVTDVCKGTRGDAHAGDIVEVRLTHDPAQGRLTARFRLAQPLDTTGDDAALLLIIASADNSRSYQVGVDWLDGELAGTWVSDMNSGQETHPSDSDVRISGSTITISFSDHTVVDLGSEWQWMASSSINSTDMDGCPSDEYEFRTFPRK